MAILTQLPIWNHFISKANSKQITSIQQLIDIASARLIQIRDTFPSYTLHNEEHANNVVRLMGQLLANRIFCLSALEAAMLILSAYFHDAGMAFSEEERATLNCEEYFIGFLREYPQALIAIQNSDKSSLPIDVAENYCRWRHADRIFDVINAIRHEHPDLLLWETQDIGNELGYLCQSHNQDASTLKDDSHFPIDYRCECDLRFCAILLRIADILDFDRSRSPEQLYNDLNLAHAQDKRKKTSDLEWRKHLASEGFVFPPDLIHDYDLGFIAGPDSPAVEHDIREFLQTIEDELAKSASVLRSCNDRWRNHPMPLHIDRRNIRSRGYTYGEHRFTLDQREVLQLLMGDKLYENPYVFVRELLQNALDTSRHREFCERSKGNADFACEPILVDEWTDREGYQWVRIQDFGMGMTESIINDFLLKVGKSYYASAQFEADVIRYSEKTGTKFKPTSRFGIGLLSCFIVCDRVEISTRHAAEPDGPIRLSLSGMHDYFILQKRPNPFKPMPSPSGDEPGEKRYYGSTVCVRLDPFKEEMPLDLGAELSKHLLCPSIPVMFQSESIGGDPKVLLDRPWCESTFIPLADKDMLRISHLLQYDFTKPLQISLRPADITSHRIHECIKGQLISVALEESEDLSYILRNRRSPDSFAPAKPPITCSLELWGKEKLICCININYQSKQNKDSASSNKTGSIYVDLMPYLSIDRKQFLILSEKSEKVLGDQNWFTRIALIGHNGIHLPPFKSLTNDMFHQAQHDLPLLPHSPASCGLVMLQDSLRPDVSVSRDRLLGLPWIAQSTCELTSRRALRAAAPQNKLLKIDTVLNALQATPPLLGELMADYLLTRKDMWTQEKLFFDDQNGGFLSVIDLQEDPSRKAIFLSHSNKPFWPPIQTTRAFLAQYWLLTSVLCETQYSDEIVVSGGKPEPITESIKLFPPLFFAQYKGNHKDVLLQSDCPYRMNHPFCIWLLEHAETMHRLCPGILRHIRQSMQYDLTSDSQGNVILKEGILRVNQSLQRISKLYPIMKPPESAYLTLADFNKK